jgi:catechol 2,3-dioxygenase-like lactoylglutathione lyase family enzyme
VFDHVTIRVSDRAATRLFYETVLAPLGHSSSHAGVEFDEWATSDLPRLETTGRERRTLDAATLDKGARRRRRRVRVEPR